MTYYKYAERKAQDEINWGEIAKNISDTMLEEKKLREDKRADIDQKTFEFSQALADAPVSQNNDITSFAAKFAGNAQDAMLQLNRNLKAGKMNLRDYTVARQNLLTSTTKMFSTFKNWDNIYKNGMERIRTGQASNVEVALKTLVEGFGKLADHDAQIDPMTYGISMMKKDETGNYITSPDGFADVKLLESVALQNVDKVDLMGKLKARADMFGKNFFSEITSTQGLMGGSVTEEQYDNIRKSSSFKGALDLAVMEVAGTDIDQARILMDYTTPENKLPWVATRDKSKAGGNVVYFREGNGGLMPELTAEQKKIVEDKVRVSLDAMIDQSYKTQSTTSNVPAYKPESGNTGSGTDNKGKGLKLAPGQKVAAQQAVLAIPRSVISQIAPELYDVGGDNKDARYMTEKVPGLSDERLVAILRFYEANRERNNWGPSLVNDNRKTSFINTIGTQAAPAQSQQGGTGYNWGAK